MFCHRRVAIGWLHDGDFIFEEVVVAERVLAAALFQQPPCLNYHVDQIEQWVRLKNRSKLFRLGPDAIFMVAQNDNV